MKRTFALVLSTLALLPGFAYAATVRSIEFPVGGPNSFRDDFGDPRGGGTRTHKGNDIIAAKMTPLFSAVDGKVLFVMSPQPSWGYEIMLVDSEGYQYDYLHVNNDTPGTDDGKGGETNAYAPGIVNGASVTKGQLIGWVGDSGNAEDTVPHLHFEIHEPSGTPIDPYDSLIVASGPYRSSNDSRGITPDVRAKLESMQDGRPDDVFKQNLDVGSSGDIVRQLQITLKVAGLLDKDSVTGYYGQKTRAAVMAFQKRQGLEQVGAVGPKTRTMLNRGIASGVLQEYKPFYTDAEKKAIEDAQKRQLEYMKNGGRSPSTGTNP
jgi:murein DD-endopeptidase MepM/ murein hydrolase activator NlpD